MHARPCVGPCVREVRGRGAGSGESRDAAPYCQCRRFTASPRSLERVNFAADGPSSLERGTPDEGPLTSVSPFEQLRRPLRSYARSDLSFSHERIETMINPNPIAKLLLHAHADERLSYEQMVRWSEEFGLDRGELIDIYEAVREAGQTCRGAFAPSPRGDCSQSSRYEVVAQAYSEGWLGLDRVLSWAEEQELDDEKTIALLERCATEGHAH